MFGLDFNKLGEMVPMIEKFAKDITDIANNLLTEQKRQGELLAKIAEKVGVDKGE